ncbi:hypothetical protein PoB_001455100 [Plakobranchus ocellatus]|uniref:Uncharacterized protein n=1 Tax=Plakobranchus ocellatus TaxID=259542 RepID=A0AAV3Z0E8_9GAST|nr:hypothetical protein PoB_001455100 [Plakobranchus ocellatus]
MAKRWAPQMLNESIQGKDRGVVCTAASTLCTFLRRPLAAGAKLSPGTYLHIGGRVPPAQRDRATLPSSTQPARLVQIQTPLDDPKIPH